MIQAAWQAVRDGPDRRHDPAGRWAPRARHHGLVAKLRLKPPRDGPTSPPRIFATRRCPGFTLIELMIVVTIVGILAAIAVPRLLRARMSSNEASAIGSLRSIASGQSTFAATCGNGFYAPSLARLATPPVGAGGFVGPELSTDPVLKSSYVVTLTPGEANPQAPASCNGAPPGTVIWTYFAGADPIPGGGARYFGLNQGGAIYRSDVPVVVTQTGAPPGATPIP